MTTGDLPPEEKRRPWLLILLVLLFICGCLAVAAWQGGPILENILSGGQQPTATPTTPPRTCGDGVCDASAKEDCTTCSKDCGDCTPACGDGACNTRAGEDCKSCSKDCGDCTPACGDSVCNKNAGEDCSSCSKDCGDCPSTCGNGVCDKDAGEDCQTCEKDCGECPVVNPRGACLDACDPANSTCQAGLQCVPEATGSSQYICWNQQICNVTSAPPCNNNGVCESGEVTSCPDCKPCVCGDGVCEQARCIEYQQNCPADCGVPDPCAGHCGNGVCQPSCGETPWDMCGDC